MAAKPNKKKQKPPTRAIPHNSTIRKFRIVEFSLTIAAGWMVKVYPLRETSSETCFTRRNSHVPSARWTMLPDPFVRRLPLAAMMFLPVGSAFGHLPQGPPKGTLLALYPGHKRPDTWQKRPFPSNRKTAESQRVRRPETLGFRRFAGVHPPYLLTLNLNVSTFFRHQSPVGISPSRGLKVTLWSPLFICRVDYIGPPGWVDAVWRHAELISFV